MATQSVKDISQATEVVAIHSRELKRFRDNTPVTTTMKVQHTEQEDYFQSLAWRERIANAIDASNVHLSQNNTQTNSSYTRPTLSGDMLSKLRNDVCEDFSMPKS